MDLVLRMAQVRFHAELSDSLPSLLYPYLCRHDNMCGIFGLLQRLAMQGGK
jgi:hypothetical protein